MRAPHLNVAPAVIAHLQLGFHLVAINKLTPRRKAISAHVFVKPTFAQRHIERLFLLETRQITYRAINMVSTDP